MRYGKLLAIILGALVGMSAALALWSIVQMAFVDLMTQVTRLPREYEQE